MPISTGYQAGIEANQTQLSYGMEAIWGTRPASGVPWQIIRYTGTTLALTKTRQRPAEINLTREASQAITTEQVAGGAINFALSFGTYDEFFAVLLQGEWSTPVSLTSSGANWTHTVGGGTGSLVTTTPGQFPINNPAVGAVIKHNGWTNPTQNTWSRVTARPNTETINFQSNLGGITEISSATVIGKLTAGSVLNGTTLRSMHIQQKFSGNKYFRYAGAYVTRCTMSVGVGNFFTGSFDILAKSEASATAEAAQGAPAVINPAPTNTVFDPVASWVNMRFPNDLAISGNLDQFSVTIENQGAISQYNLGAVPGALGILGGTLTASGSLRMFCANFTMYDRFQGELQADMTVILRDAQLNSFVISMKNVMVFCRIPVTGPSTGVMVEITFECNPDPTAAGGTIQFDRHVSTG